ncbi:MAG: hypothetical protein ACLQIB_42600 [Isosphaeraceae bacterium]
MTRILQRWARPMAPVLLAGSLLFCPLAHHEARAQPAAPGEEESAESKGRPWDGYIATGCLVFLALFIVAKSARR